MASITVPCLLIGLIILVGCQNRPAQTKPDYVVGPECHPIATLHGCDFKTDPPHCKSITLKYDDSCGNIKVRK